MNWMVEFNLIVNNAENNPISVRKENQAVIDITRDIQNIKLIHTKRVEYKHRRNANDSVERIRTASRIFFTFNGKPEVFTQLFDNNSPLNRQQIFPFHPVHMAMR